MHVWSETLVMDRAEILHIERTSWKQHEKFYKQSTYAWDNIIMLTIEMGKRDVGKGNISEVV